MRKALKQRLDSSHVYVDNANDHNNKKSECNGTVMTMKSPAKASVVQAEQSLLQSKTVLAQVVQQLQRSSKPQLPKSSDEAEAPELRTR